MRLVAGIEYQGTNYCGWQRQRTCPSIQAKVEAAFSEVADEPIQVACAGRTDRGVHALEQVVHFDTNALRSLDSWVLGGNAKLPPDIRIKWAKETTEAFHARYSAIFRHYRYLIHNSSIPSALMRNYTYWHRAPLNPVWMQQGGNYLLGEHDFSSFRGAGCQAKSVNRNLFKLAVTVEAEIISINLQANAFLLHMVRNIVGTLVKVGTGEKQPSWIAEVLQTCDRRKAATTAPAAGLYLVRIGY